MKTIVQRFQALGINQPLAEKLERLINKWERASGPEWTVKRLKALKSEFLGLLSGDRRKADWVSRNIEGLPKGPFAELFRIGLSGTRGATRAVNALMVYSVFVADTLTAAQKEKFFDSMESKDMTGVGIPVQKLKSLKLIKKDLPPAKPWTNSHLSPSCFQPGPDGKSYPETDTYISFVSSITSRPMMRLMRKYSRVFNAVFPTHVAFDMWTEGTLAMKHSESPYNACIGKISFIQEPGFKLRAVANPNRVLQAALEPLKRFLGETLAEIDEDKTFNQSSGANLVKGWLSSGRRVHSVDLSDATNLFPLDFTISCLQQLESTVRLDSEKSVYRSLVGLFSEASRETFFSKENGVVSLHRFTRGQPLGLGPSFFAFAISHHFLLRSICEEFNLSREYCILGDDIVIGSDPLHEHYLKRLAQLGCKVSRDKSFSSTQLAEFAGKLITPSDIIPQFKWREISDTNVIDFCRNIGPGAVKLLNRRQRGLIAFAAKVPSFLGGLGWNPLGDPLDIRLGDPFVNFILNKQTEVLAPSQRVDRPLIRFSSDPRLKDLTPRYITVDGLKDLWPTRHTDPTQWATDHFWNVFRRSQSSTLPLEAIFPVESLLSRVKERPGLMREFYLPLIKENSDPRQQTPWFDIIHYFNSFSLSEQLLI
jgi:hypothetical protein